MALKTAFDVIRIHNVALMEPYIGITGRVAPPADKYYRRTDDHAGVA